MLKDIRILTLIACLTVFSTVIGQGQAYFYALPDGQETFNRRIARFSNNDIIIGDSSDEGAFTQANGKVYLTRIDNCGKVVWSNSYERTNEYLEFKDIVVADDNTIYAYGSAYRGGIELLFLLQAAPNGDLLAFKLIETGTIDHFSYALDVRDGVIMLFGLDLDFNTQKQGFISVFDDNLQFRWARRFAPFESEGDAIIDHAGNFICRSDFFHYAVNHRGDLLWAEEMEHQMGASPIAGPFEVPGGYVCQAYKENYSFFYKIDMTGNLVWKSNKFPAVRNAADFQLSPDGRILAVYKHRKDGINIPAFMHIESATGSIADHYVLNIDLSLDFDHLYQSLDTKGNLTIIGNKTLIEKYPIDIPYFLFQFPLGEKSNECFGFELLDNTIPNDISVVFNPVDTALFDAQMQVEASNASTLEYSYEYQLFDHCGFRNNAQIIAADSLLLCGENWTIQLPAPDFVWQDESQEEIRTLTQPGTYIASNRDCLLPTEYHYTLDRPDCLCGVYLPNAITPNHDQVNDIFTIYSDCQIEEYHLTMYNRWGIKVYERRNGLWDGNSPRGILPQGMYIAHIEYSLRDLTGQVQKGQKMQEVLLLR